jgi:hypothetical protein
MMKALLAMAVKALDISDAHYGGQSLTETVSQMGLV